MAFLLDWAAPLLNFPSLLSSVWWQSCPSVGRTRPLASRAPHDPCSLSMIERDIAVWIVSAFLALGVGWSRYAKWRTRDKLVRELAAMDPERREKVLSHLNPRLAMGAGEH